VYKCNVSIPVMPAIWGTSSDLSRVAADEKFLFCLIDAQPLGEAVQRGGRGWTELGNVKDGIIVFSLTPCSHLALFMLVA